MVDRWENRPDPRPDLGVVYWHILLGSNTTVYATASGAQRNLVRSAVANIPGLHMTPLRWLHITLLVAGTTDDLDADAMQALLAQAKEEMAHVSPATVEIGRVVYHPEAVMVAVTPKHLLQPILDAAQSATRKVTGKDGFVNGGSSSGWTPHITLCYSTARQPAAPIIEALGRSLGTYNITVDAVSLVVQRGPERLWDWHPVGTIKLTGTGSGMPASERG